MGLLFFSVFIIYSSFAHQLLQCAARDRLAPGESISVNQTLVSAAQIFALGFFNPGNSTAAHLYAGIWYNRLPGKRAVVWVANRENPLRDPAGVLTVTEDGNMAVLDGAGGVIWSTNISGVPINTSAVLLDSGNLVLRHSEGDDYAWESFGHPTDTLLQGMVLRSNFSSGAGTRLASWRGAADPTTGEFVFAFDPKNSLQACVWKGSETCWRGAVWDGRSTTTIQLGDLTSLFVQSVVKDDDEIYQTFYTVDNSMLARYVLDYTGNFTFLNWNERLQSWNTWGSLTRPCDFYNRCGPFGACVYAQSSCRCLDGFEPRSPGDWKIGNFTGGCVRRHQLHCDGTDMYVKLPGMKLPDGFSPMWNKSMAQCEVECSATCRCQAYAYANFTSLNRTGSRCLIWLGEMTDLSQGGAVYEDLYVRLPASELGLSKLPRSEQGLLKIIMPILSLGMLFMGICCYLFIRRHKSTVEGRKTRKMVLLAGLDFSNALGSEKELPNVASLDFKIVKAVTSNFCSANKLGEGGFGPVYKGRFLNGQEIAVKRLSKGSKQGDQEFANEVRLIARLQHGNLVRLMGWCSHKDEKILIYEYMANKSLDKFLFGLSRLPGLGNPTRSAELNWEKRSRIIEGIANGLLYLHQHSRMRVIHRDLKTSNILLDGEMNPKISDFGLARIFQINQVEANTRKVVGTYGYMSPEYALGGVFSEKSDVFSFGVILLEIITGKRSTSFYPYSNSQSLFGYAWQMWEEGRALELRDPSISSSSCVTDQVLRCTQLAMLCIQEDAAERPTMSCVVSLLGNDVCPLPMPKRPGFVLGRNDKAPDTSVNELTRSLVEGR